MLWGIDPCALQGINYSKLNSRKKKKKDKPNRRKGDQGKKGIATEHDRTSDAVVYNTL